MKKTFTLISTLLILCIVGGLGAAAVAYYLVGRNLPDYKSIADYRPARVTHVYARDGSLIGQLHHEKRFPLAYEDIPEKLKLAVLAVEDAAFYNHVGVNPMAILRAFIVNIQTGREGQGASTITQQLIKNLLLTREHSYRRKAKEAILAYRLETYLTKNEILTIYLNHAFFGANAYGVEAAARVFFGKHVEELTWAEAALIAGLPQAPTTYNPYRAPDVARLRQRHVLNRLRECGWITEADYAEALSAPLVYTSMHEGMGEDAAWYFDEVRRLAVDLLSRENAARLGIDLPKYGEDAVYELGLDIRTAMNPQQQGFAVHSLRKGLEDLTKRQGWLGPAEKLAPEFVGARIQADPFMPADLANGRWVRAIVTNVAESGADVRLGGYQGRIVLKDMSWARPPNPEVAGVYAPAVRDARNVLEYGDVVWVSTRLKPSKDAKGRSEAVAPYDPLAVTPDTVIALALEQRPDVQGAIVSMEPQTGDVVALSGGYSFTDSKFNRATRAERQPGSAFKPIVYSAAIDNGFTAASIVLDAPVVQMNEHEVWRPVNYSGDFKGPILLRTALTQSRNLCTIRVAQQIGIEKVAERAKLLGLRGDFPPYLSISLGAVAVTPLNLGEAYSAFANQGLVSTPRIITEIRDADGKVLYRQEPQLREAISPQTAYVMAGLLKEVVNAGTGVRAKVLQRPVGGKTGTTNDEMDAWFVGLTPYLVTTVFVGYDKLKTLGKLETGSSAALPIFVEYGKQALEGYPPDDFSVPPGVAMARVDPRSGLLAGAGGEGLVLPFIEGTVPTRLTAGTAQDDRKSGADLLRQLY
jgi:penicillin-binding protein 1A